MENVVTSFHDGTWEGNDIFHGRTVLALQKGFDHCCLLRIGAVSHFDELEMYFIHTDLYMAQGFLSFLQNKKSPYFFSAGSHSLFNLHIFTLGLYSYEQQAEAERHSSQHLKRFSKLSVFIPGPGQVTLLCHQNTKGTSSCVWEGITRITKQQSSAGQS